jgi:hypothetical protein
METQWAIGKGDLLVSYWLETWWEMHPLGRTFIREFPKMYLLLYNIAEQGHQYSSDISPKSRQYLLGIAQMISKSF